MALVTAQGLFLALGSFLAQGCIASQGVGSEPTIRVWLLSQSGGRVVVEGGATPTEIVRVPGGGVRAGGSPAAPLWRVEAGEVHRVSGLAVRGALEVLPDESSETGLIVVNEVSMASYLAGTLAAEMYGSWSPAALEAQAVASRTYALNRRRERAGEPWHVRSGTGSQVYVGVEAESESVSSAVRATRGEILTFDGGPILAAFHSSSGGRTASAAEVWGEERIYLVSLEVEDEWDSPDSYWRAPVSRTTLGRALAAVGPDIGAIRRAEVVARTESGRAARVRFTGERGSVTLSGRRVRDALGESILKSTLFELREVGDEFVFVGSGSGHGVGMSQWGARAMARRGDGYREILRTFYPGARLHRLESAK